MISDFWQFKWISLSKQVRIYMDLLSNGDLTTQHRGGNRAWTWTPPIDDLSMTNKNLLKRQMGWAANLSLKTNHKNHKQYSWMFIWFDFQRYCNCLFGILLFSSYQKSEIGGNVTGIAWQIPPSMPETNWVGQFNLLHPSSHPTNQHNDHRVENYIEKWSCFLFLSCVYIKNGWYLDTPKWQFALRT